MADTNPYLAHRRLTTHANVKASKDPFFGFLPRRVRAEQVMKAMVRICTHHPRYASFEAIVAGREGEPIHKSALQSRIQKAVWFKEEVTGIFSDESLLRSGELLLV